MNAAKLYPGKSFRWSLGPFFVFVLVLLLSGCDTLQFYRQALWGQWQILNARTSLEKTAASPQLDDQVRERLLLAQSILTFGDEKLGLAPDGRYTSYVHLDRKYVVWNVFAAAPFELDGRHWCYPVVGCVPYRGYFSEAAARKAAKKYAHRGLETYVGGAPAYSTLGWFDDPLLSTFILWPEPDLANLLLHEMAHSKIWVNGDAAFNESFAEFVGYRGAQLWLEHAGQVAVWHSWLRQRIAWRRFRAFSVEAKTQLKKIYAEAPSAHRQQYKTMVLAGLQDCYQAHRSKLGAGRYDELMANDFNNAFLVSVGTYADWLPAFAGLFARHGERWDAFYVAVQELAKLDMEQRSTALVALAQEQIAQGADHQDADQINCQAFLRHSAD